MMRLLAAILCLLPLWAHAVCSTTTCAHGETGTCRLAASCSDDDIQDCIDAAASGGDGTLNAGVEREDTYGGDSISVPAGNCTWNENVTWANKNIYLYGAGQGVTNINVSSNRFHITTTTKNQWKITDLTFTGNPANGVIWVNPSGYNGSASAYGFVIGNVTFDFSSGMDSNVIWVSGPLHGLIHNVTATKGGVDSAKVFLQQSNYLNSECLNPGGDSVFMGEYCGRTLSTGLGDKNAIYVEDSTFTCDDALCPFVDSESGGQRLVFRYNSATATSSSNYMYFYAHWSRGGGGNYCGNGEWAGHRFEYYNNTIDGGGNSNYPFRYEAGTGVIYNNTIKNYGDLTFHVDERRGCGSETVDDMYGCDGTRGWDGNAGDAGAPGWPCAGQIGFGCIAGNCARQDLDNIPLILWNNGTGNGCATGGACADSFTVNVAEPPGCTRTHANYIKDSAHTATNYNGAYDYCDGNSAMPSTCGTYTNNYSAYTYPHPLQQAGSLDAPSNFRLISLAGLLMIGAALIFGGMYGQAAARVGGSSSTVAQRNGARRGGRVDSTMARKAQ
jgi:hypothetical protein